LSAETPIALELSTLLLGVPSALLYWRLASERRAEMPAAPQGARSIVQERVGRLAWYRDGLPIYFAIWALSAFIIAVGVLGQQLSASVSVKALSGYAMASAFAAMAPWRPACGLFAYTLASYGLPREDPIMRALTDAGAGPALALLSAIAVVIWRRRARLPTKLPSMPTAWWLLAFCAWTGIGLASVAIRGLPLNGDVFHRASRILEAITLFFVAFYAELSLLDMQLLVIAIAAMLGIRAVRFTSTVRLEQNLAAVVAIMLPWALAAGLSARRLLLRLGGFSMALGLAALVVVIANRGAVVGLAAATLVVWAISPWKWRSAAILTPLALLLALYLPRTELGRRADAAFADGQFQGSAAMRLDLWTAGVGIALEHPVLGVGPENFGVFLQQYYAPYEMPRVSAHNMYVDVLSELGFPGCFLFVGAWIAALIALLEAVRRSNNSPAQWVALAGLASACVFLLEGAFLSIHSLSISYILLGSALSLSALNLQSAGFTQRLKPAGLQTQSRGGIRVRQLLDSAALIYAAFVVLGSLAPFEFQWTTLTAAVDRFTSLPWASLKLVGLVDVTSNVLLFIPLGFLFMGSLACDVTRRGWIVLAGALAVIGSTLFGAGIEFLQLWFPERSSSPSDVLAQFLGSLGGDVIWLLTGQPLSNAWHTWREHRTPLRGIQSAIIVYWIGLVLWLCWPLELSLHPHGLLQKYRDGQIFVLLLPYVIDSAANIARWVAPNFLAALPLGWLFSSAWLLPADRPRSFFYVALCGLLWAAGFEAIALMTPSGTVCLESAAIVLGGVLAGAWLHRAFHRWMVRVPAYTYVDAAPVP
jgi:O-antigen ligase/VanZ family protein